MRHNLLYLIIVQYHFDGFHIVGPIWNLGPIKNIHIFTSVTEEHFCMQFNPGESMSQSAYYSTKKMNNFSIKKCRDIVIVRQ